MGAAGCLLWQDGYYVIAAENPFAYSDHGCTILQHEVLHIMGFKEHELPPCK